MPSVKWPTIRTRCCAKLRLDADVGVAEAPPVLRAELAPRLLIDQHELRHRQQGELALDVVDAEDRIGRD